MFHKSRECYLQALFNNYFIGLGVHVTALKIIAVRAQIKVPSLQILFKQNAQNTDSAA